MAEIVPLRLLPPQGIEILDQTLLPSEERRVILRDLDSLCEAIRQLRIRGAPLLGLAGACGMAIAAETTDASDDSLTQASATLRATRPTAVDLGAYTGRALEAGLAAGPGAEARRSTLWAFAAKVLEGRLREDASIGRHGAQVLVPARTVLTHCNAGALATGGAGTALAAIRYAWQAGTLERCFVTETRPLLQGARLTAWELMRAGIPTTLLPDTAAASLLMSGQVGAVVTGADRIAVNGDTANKVGTYGIAVLAARHGIPMYIAAPRTTFDLACPDGSHVPIEFRDAREVGGFGNQRWAPDGVAAYNPAFDVTPAVLISAFITDRGVLRHPFAGSIRAFCEEP